MAMKIKVREVHANEALSFCEKGVKEAFPKWPSRAVKLVASWYENEGAEDDFGSTSDLAAHISDDIDNMLDAASEEDAAYIRSIMRPKGKSGTWRKIKDALAHVFPGYEYESDTDDLEQGGATVQYYGFTDKKNRIPKSKYDSGIEEMRKLLPSVDITGKYRSDWVTFDFRWPAD